MPNPTITVPAVDSINIANDPGSFSLTADEAVTLARDLIVAAEESKHILPDNITIDVVDGEVDITFAEDENLITLSLSPGEVDAFIYNLQLARNEAAL